MANVGALKEAVRTCNLSLIKRLVKGGVCVNERLWYGRTLLQEAVTLEDVDMAQFFIEHGKADVNAQNDDGRTALHLASRAGDVKLVSLLLEAEANVNIQCLDGTTCLHSAMWKNKVEVVQKLIAAGANPNLQDRDHWTPLYWGVQNGNLDLVKLLIQNGARTDMVTKRLLTPLTLSVQRRYFSITKYLLFMGAGLDTIHNSKKPINFITLLLEPDLLNNYKSDVFELVNNLVTNGYNLWRDSKILHGKPKVHPCSEQLRQIMLSKIASPPSLQNVCRFQLRPLLLCQQQRTKQFSERITNLQIPDILQNFLLTRSERIQMLCESKKDCTSILSSIDSTSSNTEVKKNHIIQLKKTVSLVSSGKEMDKLEQNHPSTSKFEDTTSKQSSLEMAPNCIVIENKTPVPQDTTYKTLPGSLILPSYSTIPSTKMQLNEIPNMCRNPERKGTSKPPCATSPHNKIRKLVRLGTDTAVRPNETEMITAAKRKRRVWNTSS